MDDVLLALLLLFNVGAAVVLWQRRWRAYDPGWLVALARVQRPQDRALIDALAACTRARHESDACVHFVSPRRPNRPGSAWQFRENITLEHPEHGELVLDVLKDGRVGGVEFLDRLL